MVRRTRRQSRKSRSMRGGGSPEFDSPSEAMTAMTVGKYRAEHPSPQKSVKRKGRTARKRIKKLPTVNDAEHYYENLEHYK